MDGPADAYSGRLPPGHYVGNGHDHGHDEERLAPWVSNEHYDRSIQIAIGILREYQQQYDAGHNVIVIPITSSERAEWNHNRDNSTFTIWGNVSTPAGGVAEQKVAQLFLSSPRFGDKSMKIIRSLIKRQLMMHMHHHKVSFDANGVPSFPGDM